MAMAVQALSVPLLRAVPALGVDQLRSQGGPASIALEHPYRADAVIRVLGINLYTRKGVGSGFIKMERAEGMLSLEFGAGSYPDKAGGLNRLGYIREVAQSGNGVVQRTATFGFMSESKENTLSEATASAKKENGPTARYTALEATGESKKVKSSVWHLETPAHGWPNLKPIQTAIHERMAASKAIESVLDCTGQLPPSFLGAMYHALCSKESTGRSDYAYNGALYDLSWRTSNDGAFWKFKGELRGRNSSKVTHFQLWFDPSHAEPLPVRFEYQARDFLKLTFSRA